MPFLQPIHSCHHCHGIRSGGSCPCYSVVVSLVICMVCIPVSCVFCISHLSHPDCGHPPPLSLLLLSAVSLNCAYGNDMSSKQICCVQAAGSGAGAAAGGGGGGGPGGGSLDFLRSNNQFQALRQMVQANPSILQPMLQVQQHDCSLCKSAPCIVSRFAVPESALRKYL